MGKRKSLASSWKKRMESESSKNWSAPDLLSVRGSMRLARPRRRSLEDAQSKPLEEARWTWQEWFLGSHLGQLVMLFFVAVGLVIAGALSWVAAGPARGEAYNSSLRDALWFSWGVFFDPGTQTGLPSDERLAHKAVAVCFSILGFVFNLVLLGIIVERVRLVLDFWVGTHNKIVERGHVLVLGWTDKTLFLLGEVAEMLQGRGATAKRERIVVLGELDEAAMRSEIRTAFPAWARAFPDVTCVCRRGKPFEVEDLAKVSAQAAATIIVLGASRSSREADAQSVSTTLALRAMASAPKCVLVAELRLAQSAHVFRRLGGNRKLAPARVRFR